MHARPLRLMPLVALALAAGCGKTITVSRYPAFYTSDLRALLVAPFDNHTGRPEAGQVLASKVTADLIANGTYHIYTAADLPDLLGGQVHGGGADLAGRLRSGRRVQAILTGTVTEYAATQSSQWRERPVYRRDKDGDRVIDHYIEYHHLHNEARVAATARLIRVSDGSVLHSTPPGAASETVTSESDEDGDPPDRDLHACLAAATDAVAAELTADLAVVETEVRIPDDALKVASARMGTEWQQAERFDPADPRMLVVVDLPVECDRNRFLLTVSRKDAAAPTASAEFVWERRWSGAGKAFEFSPVELAARSGTGEYTVRLTSGGQEAGEADFRIEPPAAGGE